MRRIDRDYVENAGNDEIAGIDGNAGNADNIDNVDISLLLQRGVWVALPDRVDEQTVSSFACRILAIDPESFRNEIKTAFLNHKVVDDPVQTRIKPGDNLILSGAMPGLVGAMLRSDSPLKILRAGITASNEGDPSPGCGNLIRVKLFNTVLKNHQTDLIEYGFFVEETEP